VFAGRDRCSCCPSQFLGSERRRCGLCRAMVAAEGAAEWVRAMGLRMLFAGRSRDRALTDGLRPAPVVRSRVRPDPLGRLNDADRDCVTRLSAQARAGPGWAVVVDVLVRPAPRLPVAAAWAAAAGVDQSRVRAVCRAGGPDSVTDEDLLAG